MSEASSTIKTAMEIPDHRPNGGLAALLTFKAIIVFIALDLCFYLFGFDRTFRRAVSKKTKLSRLSGPRATIYAAMAVEAVNRATQWYYRKRLDCLPKSLTLFVLLKKTLPIDLCIGVKKFPFAGHAWVEYGNFILGDIPEKVGFYTVLSRV